MTGGRAAQLERVVVVGASLAGLRACETLRDGGFGGRVTLIGAERHLPYDRPPLSKKLLAGAWEPDRIQLRRDDVVSSLGLDLMLGRSAAGLDLDARTVVLDDGATMAFDGLVIATGAHCRRFAGLPVADGLFELRTLDDALALRARLRPGARVVVIGAGFIGLEVAATARQAGCDVTVLEAAPAPLVRGLGQQLGAAVATVHGRHGVEVRCGVGIDAVTTSAGKVDGVALGDGTVVAADVVVVGIGVTPSTDWLHGSGLELRDGVVCDATLAAMGVEQVYAAGDVARWHHGLYDEEVRIEHWTNASEQGAAAARNLMAVASSQPALAYEAVPFFWSDQFDSRIQFLGRSGADDAEMVVEVVAGDAEAGPFLALYGRHERLWGVLGVNMPRQVMPFRRLLAERSTWSDALTFAQRT